MLSWYKRRQLIRLSLMYYEDELTHSEIANITGLSRPVVTKLLQKSIDEDLINININNTSIHSQNLSLDIQNKYNLKKAIIVDHNSNMKTVHKALGISASRYLVERINSVDSIGIAWGNTLKSVVDFFPFSHNPKINVIPLSGGLGTKNVEVHSNELAYKMANKLNCSYKCLYAPFITKSPSLKKEITHIPEVAEVLDLGKKVDIALVGLGVSDENSTLSKMGYLNAYDKSQLEELGAVGDIASRFFDTSGRELNCEFHQKSIGPTLLDILNIPEVIGIATGQEKVLPVKTALIYGYIDVIIIDSLLASSLLDKVE